MDELGGKVAVITGGGSGIGRGLAIATAEHGMHAVIADIEVSAAEAVAEQLRARGARSIAVACDVAQQASVDALAERAYAEFGAVHLLCNNAGVMTMGPLALASEADWRWTFSVNVSGPVHGVRAFLPRMRAQGGPAHIVNTASIAGLVPLAAELGVYTASKYAVVGFSEMLRNELAAEGIGVSVLCPGGVQSRIGESGRNRPTEFGGPQPPSGRVSAAANQRDPLEVGRLVLHAVRDNRPYVLTTAGRAEVQQRFEAILADYAAATV